MVGTLESLEKSYIVMECLMPEQMNGLVELHNKFDIHKNSEHKKIVPLSDEAREIMKERLKPEYSLYQFVQERLERQYRECLGRRRM